VLLSTKIKSRAYTEINLGRGEIFFPLGAPGGGQHLKYKFKTFGLLDTLKVHIQSNYPVLLNLLQTKLAGKNSKLIFYVLYSSVSVLEFLGGYTTPPPYRSWWYCPFAPPLYMPLNNMIIKFILWWHDAFKILHSIKVFKEKLTDFWIIFFMFHEVGQIYQFLLNIYYVKF